MKGQKSPKLKLIFFAFKEGKYIKNYRKIEILQNNSKTTNEYNKKTILP